MGFISYSVTLHKTLAREKRTKFWPDLKVMKKIKCCEYSPGVIFTKNLIKSLSIIYTSVMSKLQNSRRKKPP